MPLYDIIRKGVVVDKAWDQVTHEKSIQAIKDALTRGIGGKMPRGSGSQYLTTQAL